jgi:hypothetical protein
LSVDTLKSAMNLKKTYSSFARGAIFLYVGGLAAERRRLDAQGITLGDDNEGEYSTLAQVRDPVGNLITFASPPRRPFPPA